MSSAVFILRPHGGEEGPYTEEEILDLLDAGEISPEDWCRIGDLPHAQVVGEVFERISVRPPRSTTRSETLIAPDVAESTDAPSREDDWEANDAGAGDACPDLAGEADDGEPGDDFSTAEAAVYHGSPSLFGYAGALAATAGVLAAGYWAGAFGARWVIASVAIAFLLVSRVLLHRARRDYLITTRRVESSVGLVSKDTRTIPLRDLRSIRLHQPWPLSWLGVGTVIFSSDAAGDRDVVFERVGRVRRIIDRVRMCQHRPSLR